MIDKKQTAKIIKTLTGTVCAYFLLCGLFVIHTSHTSHQCKYPKNSPERWSLSTRATQSTTQHPHGKFPFFDANRWQPISYRSVTFPGRHSESHIHGWYSEVNKKRPVIILTHGIRPSCKSNPEILLASSLLTESDFNVLSIDLQNYGQSSHPSRFIAYGQREYRDVLGAFDWLISQGYHSDQIGLMGMSLGAVTSAIAFSQEPQIQAVWLDSPYSDFETMFCYELNSKGLPCFFKYGVRALARLILGTALDTFKTTDALSHAAGRHIFLTHGKIDQRIPFSHAETFHSMAMRANVSIETWFVNDTGHLDAIFTYPYVYQKKLTQFFNHALSDAKQKQVGVHQSKSTRLAKHTV